MNLIRKSIILSEDGHIQRDMSDKTFWHGVVADAVAVLEPGRVSDLFPAKITRQSLLTNLMFTGHTSDIPIRSSPL
jgi:hypothetical protein